MTGTLKYLDTTNDLVNAYQDMQGLLSTSQIPGAFSFAPFYPFIAQFVSIGATTFYIILFVSGSYNTTSCGNILCCSVIVFGLTWTFFGNIILGAITTLILLMAMVEMLVLQVRIKFTVITEFLQFRAH